MLTIMTKTKTKDIWGIVTGQVEHNLSQFADSTELFQNGDRKSFEEVFEIRSLSK